MAQPTAQGTAQQVERLRQAERRCGSGKNRESEGQRGPQNRNAKIWHLRTPDGEPVVVTNLTDWARQHTADFGMEPTEASAAAISSGFRQIKRSMEGKFRRANGQPCTVSTYKGWTLVAWEEK